MSYIAVGTGKIFSVSLRGVSESLVIEGFGLERSSCSNLPAMGRDALPYTMSLKALASLTLNA